METVLCTDAYDIGNLAANDSARYILGRDAATLSMEALFAFEKTTFAWPHRGSGGEDIGNWLWVSEDAISGTAVARCLLIPRSRSCPKTGGVSPGNVVLPLDGKSNLLADDGALFWVEGHAILTCAEEACDQPVTLYAGLENADAITSLAADADFIYFRLFYR